MHHVANSTVMRETTEVARLLLQYGANAQIEPQGFPLIETAIKSNNHEMANFLLNAKANPNACNRQGKSLIQTALEGRNSDGLKLLLDSKASPQSKLMGFNPLKAAVDKNNIPAVALLLEARASPNRSEDSLGLSPLEMAAICGYREIVGLLTKNNASENSSENNLVNPLMYAGINGRLADVETILITTENVDYYDKAKPPKPGSPVTALDYAIKSAKTAFEFEFHKTQFLLIIALLLEHGAKINNPIVFYALIKDYLINTEALHYCLYKLHNQLTFQAESDLQLLSIVTEKLVLLETANSQSPKGPLIAGINKAIKNQLPPPIVIIITEYDTPLTRDAELSFTLAGINGFFNRRTAANRTPIARLQEKCSTSCSVS